MDDNKVVSLQKAKAKAAGVSLDLAEVIGQLNERFGINIDITDRRLDSFKHIFPALNEAATQTHSFIIEQDDKNMQRAFQKGVDIGKAQMMTDVIVCLLELEGLIERN